jgi:nitrile hydratase accessory protein
VSGLLAEDGQAAPPRDNGELVFAAPWESTAFAMAIGLEEAGVFTAEEFRVRLIESIAAWEALPERSRGAWSYYERWLHALQALLFDREVIGDLELHDRIATLAHHDDHDHGHPH